MLSMLSWSTGLSPKGVVGKAERASRKGGMPLSSGLSLPLAGLTERIPTMMIGTMRPSVLDSVECEVLAPSVAFEGEELFGAAMFDAETGAGEPKRNMRKKFRGGLGGLADAPASSLFCGEPLSAAANLPLSSDWRKLLKVPSSPSPATLRASAIACWLPSSRVAAVAAAATDRSLESRAVLSSPGGPPRPSLALPAPTAGFGERRLLGKDLCARSDRNPDRRSNRSDRPLGRRRLDLLDGVRGVTGRPALTVVVRASKSRSRAVCETSGRLKSRASVMARGWSVGLVTWSEEEADAGGGFRRKDIWDRLLMDAFIEVRARWRRDGRSVDVVTVGEDGEAGSGYSCASWSSWPSWTSSCCVRA